MIIYLSGPMTGLPNRNEAEFSRWARLFRDRGNQVLNPAENDGGSNNKPRSFYMRLDIESLLQANVVLLLPNWAFSKGSRLEVAIAEELDIPCYEVEEYARLQRPSKLTAKAQVFVNS